MGVVVPTRNGGERFAACMAALASQDPPAAAIVVIDSGSEDGTPEVARDHGAQVFTIAPATFDHGVTRNQAAAALPRVDVVAFLVQDAVPLGDDYLATLAEATYRPGVAAATARQVAPAGAGFLTRATVAASPFADTEPVETGPFTALELSALAPRAWRRLLMLDDVASAVRGDVFRRCGFRPAGHGEDVLLAYDLLCAGWMIVHEPDAVVEHGHEYDPAGAYERYRADARFFRERFGFRVRPSLTSAIKGWAAEVGRDLRWLARRPEDRERGAVLRSLALRRAQVAGQLRGSRGPLGRLPDRREMPRAATLDAALRDHEPAA